MRARPFVLVVLLVALPAMAAPGAAEPIPFHVSTVVEGRFEIEPDAPDPYICVIALAVDVVLEGQSGKRYTFEQDGKASSCGPVEDGVLTIRAGGVQVSRDGGGNITLHEGGKTIGVLAFAQSPNLARNPGVYVLSGRGVALLVDGLSPEGRIGMNVDAGHHVTVFDLTQLRPVERLEGPLEERRVIAGSDDSWDTRYVVAVDSAAPGGEVRVDWEDPLWFRPDPTIGQVAVVVAALLFIVFYRPAPKDTRHA